MDLSGATPAQKFALLVKDTFTHPPKTTAEAVALYKYLLRSQIEPAMTAVLNVCIADLPDAEKVLVQAAVKEAEAVLTKCGCW